MRKDVHDVRRREMNFLRTDKLSQIKSYKNYGNSQLHLRASA